MNRKRFFRIGIALAGIGASLALGSCSKNQTAGALSSTNAQSQGAAPGGGETKSGRAGSDKYAKGGKGGAMPGALLPVAAATAKADAFPVYINALGTAAAWNTVAIRSRVDGTLDKLHFTEGQRVKSGDLLAEIDPRTYQVQLDQAQGQLARDQALLANAKLDLQRYEDAREAVTIQQIDTARSSVAQYSGAVQIDQSAIDNAKLQLTYCRITSPIDGITGLRQIDEGNLVQAGGGTNSIVVVTQDDPVAVFFGVPEDNLPAIRRALASDPSGRTLAVEAYDRAMRTRLAAGYVSAIDNQIDTTTGTVRLKARFENAARALYPNQFVNIRLLVDTLRDVVLVPVTAVQINDKACYVFVVKTDQTIEQRTVTAGLSDATRIVITQGLAPGEQVVVDGLDKLQNGSRVTVREANAVTVREPNANTAPGTPGNRGPR